MLEGHWAPGPGRGCMFPSSHRMRWDPSHYIILCACLNHLMRSSSRSCLSRPHCAVQGVRLVPLNEMVDAITINKKVKATIGECTLKTEELKWGSMKCRPWEAARAARARGGQSYCLMQQGGNADREDRERK